MKGSGALSGWQISAVRPELSGSCVPESVFVSLILPAWQTAELNPEGE